MEKNEHSFITLRDYCSEDRQMHSYSYLGDIDVT